MIILIVDDDLCTLELRKSQFERTAKSKNIDCLIRTARTLTEAIEEMRKIPPPDLVLLDLIFAGHQPMTAEATILEISKFKAISSDVKVMVLTGSPDERLRQMALEYGADSFAQKHHVISQEKLFRACATAFKDTGGQSMLDCLNKLLTPDTIS